MNLEQAPNPENRIRLGTQCDALGLPKVQIEWRWREADQHNLESLRDWECSCRHPESAPILMDITIWALPACTAIHARVWWTKTAGCMAWPIYSWPGAQCFRREATPTRR